ncbi:YqkE family protein [Niallia sp. JL1B1071]|uniref:YqkE family protein n=1 Tax=Niallia tiangongensis TaxID=3237105 RepID=UPI0037DDC5E4
MAKQRKNIQKEKQLDKPVTLGDLLNDQLAAQLKNKKQELKEQEEAKLKAEEKRKREERRQREKNKSFEELLNENSMNWKDFK